MKGFVMKIKPEWWDWIPGVIMGVAMTGFFVVVGYCENHPVNQVKCEQTSSAH